MSEKKQLGFYLDIRSCIGCKACMTACKDKNDLAVDMNWRKVLLQSGGSWHVEKEDMTPVGIFVYHLSVSCQHCLSPACMEVCPVSAISKDDDGIVLIDQEKCVGCQSCFSACPYDTPQYIDSGEMSKCDMCADLRAMNENPACIDACPLRALQWGDMAELRAKYGNIRAVDPLPDDSLTGPSLILTPHRHTQTE